MSDLVINGGKKLHGEVENQSAKNSAVSILCACAMLKDRVVLENAPKIEEVGRLMELLRSIGIKVAESGAGKLAVDSSGPLDLTKIDRLATEKIRASLLLLGALAWFKTDYRLYKSGGCTLGERTVRPHIFALEKFGVNISAKQRYYEVSNKGLRAADLVMYESGDTPTENAVMAAVLSPGKTVIKMASANYMVQDLCFFLKKAGARIKGIGTTTLVIEGVKKLKGGFSYSIMPDPIVAMTFISAAICTGSRLLVKNCPMEFLELELCKLEKMGLKYNLKNKRKHKGGGLFEIADIEIIPSKLTALPDKIYGRPFPGLNIDNLPLFVPILAKARGRTLVHDWAYENRSVYYHELEKFGAKVEVLDPHRVWVEGPTEFKPNEIDSPPALRPAVAIFIAMLAAKGRSVFRNTYTIDRGYENLYETLNKLGADIKLEIKN